jgi:hypothetical protein
MKIELIYNNMNTIIKDFDKFKPISENVEWHLKEGINFTKNIFRPGSESFYALLEEVRELYDGGRLVLEGLDRDLYESTDIGRFGVFMGEKVPLDIPMMNDEWINESEYRGKKVKLNSPMRSSGPKKYKVYVKNPKTGNVMQVNFGDLKGGLSSKINDPEARKSFVARHKCKEKKDKTKPGYWSCRLPRYAKNLGLSGNFSGYW